MSDAEFPPGTQQAAETINNYNHNTGKVSDQGLLLQGSIGEDAAKIAIKEKQESNTSGGSAHHSSGPNHVEQICKKCQHASPNESNCRCTSAHVEPSEWQKHSFHLNDDSRRQEVRQGELYRIWQPGNAVMHLSTILIMVNRGRCWSACKVFLKRDVTKWEKHKSYCAPVHVHTANSRVPSVDYHVQQVDCHPLYILPHTSQKIYPDCCVDLERSFDIGNEENYQFIYCGKLAQESWKWAIKKHFELYTG